MLSGSASKNVILTKASIGGALLSGNSSYVSPDWEYITNGKVNITGASSSNLLGILYTHIGSTSDNTLLRVDYPMDEYLDELPIVQDTVITDCGCNPSPLILYLTHNINYLNNFNDFLTNNLFSLPSTLSLRFDSVDQIWRNSFYYKGIGLENTLEEWRVLLEWGCASVVSGLLLDRSAWKFSVKIVRKILDTGDNFETRLLYTFNNGAPCFNDQLFFGFSVDTRTGEVDSTTFPANIDTVIFTDEIGLFKGSQWSSNPSLQITIKEVESTLATGTIDISPIFPEATLLTIR